RVSAEIKSGLEEGEKVVVSTGSTGSGNTRDNRNQRGMRMPPMF
ncbi:MAG: macrolide transporter subunit MacA, partial [Ensifer adhaerens]|nr:macrolide transporter subunit MacA [Ensifer adhaerens]